MSLSQKMSPMTTEPGKFRLGCDIGGTFTDFVLLDEATGRLRIQKCLSTPRDPSESVMQGLDALTHNSVEYLTELKRIAHASTLVANAVIQRKGARCALLCTKGFRDLLEVRRHVRVTTYELWSDPPEPLIPRFLRLPVDERILADGTVLKAVDGDELAAIADFLRREKVESVAIAFMHSYQNPVNELEAQRILAKRLPEIPISTSSSVLPQIREYERTSTTVVNAYVRPLVEQYLSRLTARLEERGVKAPLYVMLSNGGIAAPDTAMEFPIRLIESGPVAGAIVSQYYRGICGLEDVLAFDMGGTTAKGCLLRDGEIPITSELEVARSQRFVKSSGFPIAVPGAHLIEIGAGGGSIAAVNSLGLLQVGPESAAAEPGPACYGLGGDRPTVTDADLLLGFLNADYFAGGSMNLHTGRAEQAVREHVAAPLGRSLTAAAWSIYDVINETMAAAIRMHSTERGGRLDQATLIAFGGAGPVHACALAKKLLIPKVLVPLRAGVLSAVGLLIAPPAYDIVKTYRTPLITLNEGALEAEYQRIEAQIARVLRDVDPVGAVTYARAADVGYIGQGYQVSVPTSDLGRGVSGATLWSHFAEIYRGKYGYFYEDVPAEVVNLRVSGQITTSRFDVQAFAGTDGPLRASERGRLAYSAALQCMTSHAVYDRAALDVGTRIRGPAVIEELSSTTVVDVGGEVEVDPYGSLLIELAKE
jgi:N-methylhydantoinase A